MNAKTRLQGDLVVIDGAVDHLSLANTSTTSRHTFQLHLIEGKWRLQITLQQITFSLVSFLKGRKKAMLY
jgi:hypothetical protein